MIKKSKKIKSVYDGENWLRVKNLVEASGVPYKISQSTYTLAIDCPIPELCIYFMQNVHGIAPFKIYNSIKKHISDNAIAVPEVDKRRLNYYEFNFVEKVRNAPDVIFNIDISAAYAQSMLNNGFVSKKIYGAMMRLNKLDRLAAIGMLASSKIHYSYNADGELIEIENEVSGNSGFFFNCVLDVQNVMQNVVAEIGDDFLFYWVDGLYFKTEANRERIEAIIASFGYKSKFERLTNFEAIENKRRTTLSFIKSDGKKKVFRIPKHDLSVNAEIIEALNLHTSTDLVIKKTIKK